MSRDLNSRETVVMGSQPEERSEKLEVMEGGGVQKNWMYDAALLFLAEMPQITIAKRLRKPLEMIMGLSRMPEFKAILASLASEDDIGVAQKLIRGSTTDSVLTLMKLRDDPNVKPETRRGCANDLLNRSLGKVPDSMKILPKTSVMEEMEAMASSGMDPAEWLDTQIAQTLEQSGGLKNSLFKKMGEEKPTIAKQEGTPSNPIPTLPKLP